MKTYSFPTSLELAPPVRQVLEELVRRHQSPQQLARRARLILELAAGGSNTEVARRVQMHHNRVQAWRDRWLAGATALAPVLDEPRMLEKRVIILLEDRPRAGTPPTFTPEQVAAIVALACEPPEAAGVPLTHWSHKTLAAEAVHRGIVERISSQRVGVFLKGRGVAPAQGQALADASSGRPRGVR